MILINEIKKRVFPVSFSFLLFSLKGKTIISNSLDKNHPGGR